MAKVLALFAVGDVYASLCKKGAYAPFSAQRRSRGYFGCNLLHRNVLASCHQHLMAEAPASQRSVGLLFLVSGLIALTLSAVGTYGMAASALASRRPELGLRMALGAGPRDVRRFILDKGVKPLAMGLVLGLVASLALSRFIEHLLIGVSARDTFAFAAGVAAMAMSGIAASYVPALRASRIDPATALRSE